MDRQVLLRKIMGAGDEIRRLLQDITALQSIDIVNYPENYSSLSQQAVIRSEYINRKLRAFVLILENPVVAEFSARHFQAVKNFIKIRPCFFLQFLCHDYWPWHCSLSSSSLMASIGESKVPSGFSKHFIEVLENSRAKDAITIES